MSKNVRTSEKKCLTPNDRKDLTDWLESLKVDIHELHLKSSDCLAVARFVKKLYPKLVDMFKYTERSAMKLKLENWQRFSTQVLRKLDLPQKPADLQRYVNGDKDALNVLLFGIMRRFLDSSGDKNRGAGDSPDSDSEHYDRHQYVLVNIDRVVNGEVVRVQERMISYAAFEQAANTKRILEEAFCRASQRVADLEKLAEEKTKEIDRLVMVLTQDAVRALDLSKREDGREATGVEDDSEKDADAFFDEIGEEEIEDEITKDLLS